MQEKSLIDMAKESSQAFDVLMADAERGVSELRKQGIKVSVSEYITYTPKYWLRPSQCAPAESEEHKVICFLGGRGSGKTYAMSARIVSLAVQYAGIQIGLVARTPQKVQEVLIEGESGVAKLTPSWIGFKFTQSRRRFEFGNGSFITYFSSANPNDYNGFQCHHMFVDELALLYHPERIFSELLATARLEGAGKSTITVATTPSPARDKNGLEGNKLFNRLVSDTYFRDVEGYDRERCYHTFLSTHDNTNIDKDFYKTLVTSYKGTRYEKVYLEGRVPEIVEGALFTEDMLITANDGKDVYKRENQERVIVCVDPAIEKRQNETENNETGICVASKENDHRFWIVDDLSGNFTANEWASKAVQAYHRHQANEIFVERNQGGQMVVDAIRNIDPSAKVAAEYTHKSKALRAEPVAIMYERGIVRHRLPFDALEKQMTSWVPDTFSPDRIDAMVYALSRLSTKQRKALFT